MASVNVDPGQAGSFELQHPHRNVRIHFHPDVVQALASQSLKELKQDKEIGGILWGKPSEDSVEILDATPVPAAGSRFHGSLLESRNLVQALGRPPKPILSPMGYFRSHLRDGLSLTEQDRSFIAEHFRESESVFLIIKPFPAGICTAGFFFWRDGQLPEESELEIPFVVDRKSSRDSAPASDPQAPEPTIVDILRESAKRHAGSPGNFSKSSIEIPSARMPNGERATSSTGRLLLVTTLAAMFIGVAATGLYLEWPAVRSFLQGTEEKAPEPGIDLKVSRGPDGRLSLNWNHNAQEVLNAKSGTLFIKDGRRSSKLELDSAQLRAGTLLYAPKSANVQFRLELQVNGAGIVAQSVQLAKPSRSAQAQGVQRFPVSRSYVWVPNPDTTLASTPIPPTKLVVPLVPAARLTLPSITYPPELNAPYTPPRVVQEMMPATTPLGRFARISVEVNIDLTGHVTNARVVDRAVDRQDDALATTAVDAARQWRFQPATLGGDPVAAAYTIVFAFRPQLPEVASH